MIRVKGVSGSVSEEKGGQGVWVRRSGSVGREAREYG